MFLFLALACDPAELKLDDTASVTDDSSVNTDDSGSSDDSSSTDDSEDPPPSDEGDYAGELLLVLENDWQPANCDGEVAFNINEDGDIEGTASCFMDQWQQEWAGDLVGVDSDGNIDATWTIPWGWNGEVLDVPVTGDVAEGTANLVIEYDMGRMGFMNGTAKAERQ